MRRAVGTGSISRSGEQWFARVYLIGGKRKSRVKYSEAEAEAALEELLTEFKDQLGYFYRWPRPYHAGKGPKRLRGRMSTSRRFAVLDRDGFRCVYCGNTPNEARLVVDHVLPVADGGTGDMDNLVTACLPCNAGKSARRLLNKPAVLLDRAASAE